MNSIVKRQIIKCYGEVRRAYSKYSWSLKDVLSVFGYFFTKYTEVFGREHPHLSNNSIYEIIMKLPNSYDGTSENELWLPDYYVSLDPELYPDMIDSYFQQPFQNCNYSMSHFMYGDIRILRYYELFY